jgi:hypothetical protein
MINLTSPLLLTITFVFGILILLTHIKIFNKTIEFIFTAFIPYKENSKFGKFLKLLGVWFFTYHYCIKHGIGYFI